MFLGYTAGTSHDACLCWGQKCAIEPSLALLRESNILPALTWHQSGAKGPKNTPEPCAQTSLAPRHNVQPKGA